MIPYFYNYHLRNTNLFVGLWRKVQHISEKVLPVKGRKPTTCHGKRGKVQFISLFIPYLWKVLTMIYRSELKSLTIVSI